MSGTGQQVKQLYNTIVYFTIIINIFKETTFQGNYRIFTLHRVPKTNLVEGTRGEVKFSISRQNYVVHNIIVVRDTEQKHKRKTIQIHF